MNEISGFVEISSDRLKIACKNYLDKRRKNIDTRREGLIQEEMNRKGMFGRRKVRTRAEAIANLKVVREIFLTSRWEQEAETGIYWANKVKDLQDSSCLAPSVLVEVNMASLLKPYFSAEHVTNE